MFDSIKNLLGILAAIGGGALALAKWWDSRKQDQRTERTAREDWLINNAFDIVKGLREELTRLREVNKVQAEDLDACHERIRLLESVLRSHGVDLPIEASGN
jgi:hypothetical protein